MRSSLALVAAAVAISLFCLAAAFLAREGSIFGVSIPRQIATERARGGSQARSTALIPLNESIVGPIVPPPAPLPAKPAMSYFRLGTLDELAEIWAERGQSLFVPAWLPRGFKLVAVYISENVTRGMSILLYSNSSDADMKTAELAIQTRFGIYSPEGETLRVGDLKIHVVEKFWVDWPEYREKYGTPYCTFIVVNAGGVDYSFRVSPALSFEDALRIAESMRPYLPAQPPA